MARHAGSPDDRDYEPRETVRPAAGVETEQWPDMGEWERVRQLVTEHARQLGRNGAGKRELFGKAGSIKKLIDSVVQKRCAEIESAALDERRKLESTVNSSGVRARAMVKAAGAQDRRTAEHESRATQLAVQVDEVSEQEADLRPGQRSARLVGKEAAAAAVSTGVGDAAAFVLTLNAIGGPLWLRVAIAISLALMLNVAVMAAARTLAGIWSLLTDAARSLQVAAGGVVVAALAFLLERTLFAAGDFRNHAFVNLERGVPTDPTFLVWVAITGAFGATITLSWWHYASEGDRLARRRRALEGRQAQADADRISSAALADGLRDKAFEILAEARSAQAALKRLPELVEKLKVAQKAEGATALEAARVGFTAGAQALANYEKEKKPVETIDPDTEREIDAMIKEILG